MKTWQKVSTFLVVGAGIFVMVGLAGAASVSELQPAATVTINEEFVVNSTGRFDSVYIGKQATGGVTFFNGTIINNTTSSDDAAGEAEAGNPVTFGDDVRIDGAIWRSTANDGGTSPVKVYDDMTVNGNITGDYIYSDNLVYGQNVQATYSLFARDMRLTPIGGGAVGAKETTTEPEPASSVYDSDNNLSACTSTYYGYMIFSTDPIGGGGANQFYGCTADGWKEL